MDPRYNQWPQQGYQHPQYAPPPPPPQPPNGYVPNGYIHYPQQSMPQGYPQSQPVHVQPRVVIPRLPQQYPQMQNHPQGQPLPPPRAAQPQVVIPARNPNPMAHMQNPRIRQVQVPVQRMQQRSSTGGYVEQRQPQGQAQAQYQIPNLKSAHGSQSFQENTPGSQQRHANVLTSNQHRTPLQPQSTPKSQPHLHIQTPKSQHRSPSLAQTPSQSRSHPQVVIKKTTPQAIPTPTRPQHAPPARALPADLAVLLLSAADEYINVAHGMGSVIAMAQRESDLQRYYKLMSTALGCMETVLKSFNLVPRDEAKLRLRYASLLIEETDNNVQIEAVLTKGIALCNRSHLNDLKYTMQHLHARYQFQTNHRAALRSLDQTIAETETFQHIVWVYAFRFLKVSLSLQVPGRPEYTSALQQLHAIANHADRRGDNAIFVTCSALEAMIHLRTSGPDHLEHVQRAIAAARSYQLQCSAKQLGRISALIDCIDVACSIQQGQPNLEKVMALQQKADQESGPDHGIFTVLVEKSFGGNLTYVTGGVFEKAPDGRDQLVFSWLPKNDIKMLTYFLSGMVSLPHEKGLSYLQEGFKLTQHNLQRHASFGASIPSAILQRNWMATLDWNLRFVLGLMACHLEDRVHSKKALTSLRSRVTQQPFNNAERYTRVVSYLEAVYQQTRGSIDEALSTYSLPAFNLPEAGATGATSDFKTDIAILATMNRLLILRNPAHPEHYLTGVLFSQLEPLCNSHPNYYIEGAFRIIRALTTSENSINRQKTLISNALGASQKLQNAQFVTMALNYMTSRFFAEQVGEQSMKSVRAARSVARQQGSVLWRAVSYGLCINTFQRNGLEEDARSSQEAFNELRDRLPTPLRNDGGGVKIERDGDVKMAG
ncbi:hypothetical protein K504DRAFT_429600 [Pleomassaria siparia CBS 279.74]|uniref:Cohesin loading factor-domain-containing protein n=1 Tax=Pleomassaria siparia CBS 279.74 TaxID=1314801 RepID=A0A6G1KDU2_9PLEO|nr:hypothetical protein K504DRAFT_429600 [Pleomassaria siparia CBS 279.74]